MPDREKVKRGLWHCLNRGIIHCRDCPYDGIAFCVEKVQSDALELLKEETPIIRCGECRYYDKHGASGGMGWCSRPGAGCGTAEDFFCAGAKAREAGDEKP